MSAFPNQAAERLQEAIRGLAEIVKSADESRSKNPTEMDENWHPTSTSLAERWIKQLHAVAQHLPPANVVEFVKDVDNLQFPIQMIIEGPRFPECWFKSNRPIAPGVTLRLQSAAQHPDHYINRARRSLEQLE